MTSNQETTMTPYEAVDRDGNKLLIRPSMDYRGSAAIDCDPGGPGAVFRVAAHELRDHCAALYTACGQPVPDLPFIHDEAQVEALTKMLHAAYGCRGGMDADNRPAAIALLARGVRLAGPAGAMYFHAGLEVPDLPVIEDEATIRALSVILAAAFDGDDTGWGLSARKLLAHREKLRELLS